MSPAHSLPLNPNDKGPYLVPCHLRVKLGPGYDRWYLTDHHGKNGWFTQSLAWQTQSVLDFVSEGANLTLIL
jgi:hypothetical protein